MEVVHKDSRIMLLPDEVHKLYVTLILSVFKDGTKDRNNRTSGNHPPVCLLVEEVSEIYSVGRRSHFLVLNDSSSWSVPLPRMY